MMAHISELTGTDKPILQEKKDGMFTFDELVYNYENTNEYEAVAYMPETTGDDEFYQKLYVKINK